MSEIIKAVLQDFCHSIYYMVGKFIALWILF